jgi:hypothetical protein
MNYSEIRLCIKHNERCVACRLRDSDRRSGGGHCHALITAFVVVFFADERVAPRDDTTRSSPSSSSSSSSS